MTEPRLRIAVVGAGIGGLAASALLQRAGHRVTLFDQFDAPRAVGSGLVIQPVGQAVLDILGVGYAAMAQGAPLRRMLGLEVGHGRRVLDVSYDRGGSGQRGLAIHRASLFQVLLGAAQAAGVPLVTGARVTGAPPDGATRRICLEGGAQHGPFDLVVDASGARSALSPIRARPLPYGAIWGTVPWPEDTPLPDDQLTQRYRRADRMLGVMPIGTGPSDTQRQAAIFWSMRADRVADWQAQPLAEWKAEAEAIWPDFAPFLRTIRSHADMTPATYSHGTLARPYAPGMVFIGDAAHRASPQLGQGANMALLDALALTHALDDASGEDALRAYAAMRRWHVRIYQTLSRVFTPQYQSDSRALPLLRDLALFPVSMTPPIPALLTRLVAGTMIPPLAGQAFP